ncbi:hypothetical protein [Paenibacillus sp. FJAT-27812]|uniref:hypothetical protein n=1 Tax=Paenibacillus sp. FJAT-27812 TaxID=1684143 RepID=UPI0006A78D21
MQIFHGGRMCPPELLPLADQQLDYLHISVGAFWNGSIRDANDQTSRGVMVHDRVGDRIPVMGVGMLRTPDEVMKALETGIPLLALGRELIMEPHWVQKVEAGEEEKIRTTLSKEDQKELVIPDQMWEYYTSIPGWVPHRLSRVRANINLSPSPLKKHGDIGQSQNT